MTSPVRPGFQNTHALYTAAVDALHNSIKPAGFAEDLSKEAHQNVFLDTPYASDSYYEALLSFRNDYISGIDKKKLEDLAKKIFLQPLWKTASLVLNFGSASTSSLSSQLKFDRKVIESKAEEFGQGTLVKEGLKFGAVSGLGFDPHCNGNLPFSVGTLGVSEEREVNILRHGSPVIEEAKRSGGDFFSSRIAEEYKAFLDSCVSEGKKVLYCCLLNPKKGAFGVLKTGDEKTRFQTLLKLEKEYPDTFHFIRIPADGFFKKGVENKSISLSGFKTQIEENLESLRNLDFDLLIPFLAGDPDMDPGHTFTIEGFIPGSARMRDLLCAHYKPLLEFAYNTITSVYPIDNEETRIEKKQILMMLFSCLLRSVLIKELGIDYYNNTCKDAIDRGAMHLVSDLLWHTFLAGSLEQDFLTIRELAAWPAFMAKTQNVLHDRADWMDAFASFIDKLSKKSLEEQESVKSQYQNLGLSTGSGIHFNHRESKPSKDLEFNLKYWIKERQRDGNLSLEMKELPGYNRAIPLNRFKFISNQILQNLPVLLKNHFSDPHLEFTVCSDTFTRKKFFSVDPENSNRGYICNVALKVSSSHSFSKKEETFFFPKILVELTPYQRRLESLLDAKLSIPSFSIHESEIKIEHPEDGETLEEIWARLQPPERKIPAKEAGPPVESFQPEVRRSQTVMLTNAREELPSPEELGYCTEAPSEPEKFAEVKEVNNAPRFRPFVMVAGAIVCLTIGLKSFYKNYVNVQTVEEVIQKSSNLLSTDPLSNNNVLKPLITNFAPAFNFSNLPFCRKEDYPLLAASPTLLPSLKVFPISLSAVNPIDSNDVSAALRPIDKVNEIAQNLLKQDICHFSTTFKIAAAVLISAAALYAARQIYHHLQPTIIEPTNPSS